MNEQEELLIGASIPTGTETVKDFQKLKLGELVLMSLPDNAEDARRVMEYCRDNGIYVMISELMHRGGNLRWTCPSLDRDTFNDIVKSAGKYYLGRYTIGEAGGILYWLPSYLYNSEEKEFDENGYPLHPRDAYVKLPKVDNVIDAKNNFVSYLKKFIDMERKFIGDGPLINVDSSLLFQYQVEAGIDLSTLEMLPGNPLRMLPALRGSSVITGRPWGVHIAFGWYGGVEPDELWMKRWSQTLPLCYLSGANFIFPESGYYVHKNHTYDYKFNDPKMKEARKVLRDFYRFKKIHGRAKGEPERRLAIIFGQYDGCPGLWNKYCWGQFENGREWVSGDAEHSWDLTDVLTTRDNPYNELYIGRNSYSGNPPCGQYDIVSADASVETLSKYTHILFLGFNLMDEALYNRLTAYVKNGGNLLMGLPHLNVEAKRGAPIRLFNNGDFTQLFGVKVTGKEEPEVIGFKAIYGRSTLFDTGPIVRDPVAVGNLTRGKLEITSGHAEIIGGYSEGFIDTIDSVAARPAVIEHRLGKGKARLVNSFDYPGSEPMHDLAVYLLRSTALEAQGDVRVLSADSVRYAVYRQDDMIFVYAMNTEFDISQNIRIEYKGRISRELSIPPSAMRIAVIKHDVLLSPERIEWRLEAWNDGKCELALIEKQNVALENLGEDILSFEINGREVKLTAGRMAFVECEKNQGSIEDEFFSEDYPEEPDFIPSNTIVPY